jgi:hypothetical protein
LSFVLFPHFNALYIYKKSVLYIKKKNTVNLFPNLKFDVVWLYTNAFFIQLIWYKLKLSVVTDAIN